ncbi:hypothetical protein R6Q59_002965 [Mikania micrantha]
MDFSLFLCFVQIFCFFESLLVQFDGFGSWVVDCSAKTHRHHWDWGAMSSFVSFAVCSWLFSRLYRGWNYLSWIGDRCGPCWFHTNPALWEIWGCKLWLVWPWNHMDWGCPYMTPAWAWFFWDKTFGFWVLGCSSEEGYVGSYGRNMGLVLVTCRWAWIDFLLPRLMGNWTCLIWVCSAVWAIYLGCLMWLVLGRMVGLRPIDIGS